MALRWREMDSNFHYAGAVKLVKPVVPPGCLGRGAPGRLGHGLDFFGLPAGAEWIRTFSSALEDGFVGSSELGPIRT